MDKETLSNYGWIVVLVLVLAVLLAMATPFGNFIAGAIKSTTVGFYHVNQNAFGAVGIAISDQNFESTEDTQLDISQLANSVYIGYYSDEWWDELPIACIFDENGTVRFEINNGRGDGDFDFVEPEVSNNKITYEELLIDLVISDDGSKLNGSCLGVEMTFNNYPLTEDGVIITNDGKTVLYVLGEKNDALTSYVIPSTVEKIGNCAFICCANLTAIEIPDSVTTIGDYAFAYCTSLTSITIPDSVTSIGNYAFEYCDNLTSITIPDSVKSIGDYAFAYCTNLTSITLPDSVTTIGDGAFRSCTNLTSVTLGNSVTSIGANAFYKCSNLTSITIPDSVTTIGDYAFAYCTNLTSVTLGNSVTTIGGGAFDSCTSLTSITIPDSVTTIGNYAFYDCDSLTTITIPDGVTSIGNNAFHSCSSLETVTIGNSVETIGDYAFCGCTSITSITFNGTTAEWNAITFGYYWNFTTGTYRIHCTDGCLSTSGNSAPCTCTDHTN